MYYDHFGFRHPPFKITPDTSLFFPGGNRGVILEALSYAIQNGEGIIKVVGEVGSGKTMLCRMLELELPEHIEIVYLANPRLSPDNILQAIAFELNLPVADDENRLQLMQSLQNYLLERHAANKQVVMFVEEAQSMPLATLEEIRLLSNLETNQHKLLQIVLFGQPELDDMLAKPQIRQLKERISYNFNLEPLKQTEIKDYLNARLRSCGYRGRPLFTKAGINLITRYSQGLLRRANILADKALLAAYANNNRRVGRRQVMAAVKDSEFRLPWSHYLLPVGLALLLLSLSALLYQQYRDGWPWVTMDLAAPEIAKTNKSGETRDKQEQVDVEQPFDRQHPVIGTQPIDDRNIWAGSDSGWQTSLDKQTGMATNKSSPDVSAEAAAERVKYNGEKAYIAFMQASLRRLPPEEVWLDPPASQDSACRRCTAIIYRPLQGTEKL